MKVSCRAAIQDHSFFTPALQVDEWSASHPGQNAHVLIEQGDWWAPELVETF